MTSIYYYTSAQNTCTRLVQIASRDRRDVDKYAVLPVRAGNSSRGQR